MTSSSGTSRNGRLLKIIGGSLLLIAIGFIALFAVLIANDTAWSTTTRVPVFFLSCAAVLAFVGWLYLKPESQLRSGTDARKLDILLGKCGRLIELLALTGFVLMLAHALCVCLGINWPSPVALWILVAMPLAILLSMKKILAPDTFQTGFFSPESWNSRSGVIRFAVAAILRVHRVGFLAVSFLGFRLDQYVPQRWRVASQIAASLLISLLYASQCVALHLGIRKSGDL